MWGAPTEIPDHAERACTTALEMLRRIPDLNRVWSPIITDETEFGIGINSGRALVGNIGTDRKFKYGPLGNTVNLASRVQGVTKFLNSNLLVTEATRNALPASAFQGQIRRVCKVRVLNIDEPVELFEISNQSGPDWTHLREKYEQALAAYEAGKILEAISLLGKVLSLNPDDGPTFHLLNRIAAARTNPDEPIDTVWKLEQK
jgi:adenylate cyclase